MNKQFRNNVDRIDEVMSGLRNKITIEHNGDLRKWMHWVDNFLTLQEFKSVYKHTKATKWTQDGERFKNLHRWVQRQRDARKAKTLDQVQIDLLDSISFLWNVRKGKEKQNRNGDAAVFAGVVSTGVAGVVSTVTVPATTTAVTAAVTATVTAAATVPTVAAAGVTTSPHATNVPAPAGAAAGVATNIPAPTVAADGVTTSPHATNVPAPAVAATAGSIEDIGDANVAIPSPAYTDVPTTTDPTATGTITNPTMNIHRQVNEQVNDFDGFDGQFDDACACDDACVDSSMLDTPNDRHRDFDFDRDEAESVGGQFDDASEMETVSQITTGMTTQNNGLPIPTTLSFRPSAKATRNTCQFGTDISPEGMELTNNHTGPRPSTNLNEPEQPIEPHRPSATPPTEEPPKGPDALEAPEEQEHQAAEAVSTGESPTEESSSHRRSSRKRSQPHRYEDTSQLAVSQDNETVATQTAATQSPNGPTRGDTKRKKSDPVKNYNTEVH